MNVVEDLASRRVQTSIATAFMREAGVLGLAGRYLRARRPRILSFGCSVGKELATLRVLFPQAEIFGCDVDEHALRVAQAKVSHLASVFHSSMANIAAHGPFDMICAFSSLCINPFPGLDKIRQDFPFSQFEDLLYFLDTQLVPGGLLCLQNTSYPFGTTGLAIRYDCIRTDRFIQNGFIPVVHPVEGMILTQVATQFGWLHRIGNVAGISDWDLIDCVFLKQLPGSEAPAVRWHRTAWEHPPEFATPYASWRESNLDAYRADGRSDLLEIVENYEAFLSELDPSQVLLVHKQARRCLHSKEFLPFRTEGRIMTAAGGVG